MLTRLLGIKMFLSLMPQLDINMMSELYKMFPRWTLLKMLPNWSTNIRCLLEKMLSRWHAVQQEVDVSDEYSTVKSMNSWCHFLSDVLLPVALFKMPSMHLQARCTPWGWRSIHLHEWWNHMDVLHLLMPFPHLDLQRDRMALMVGPLSLMHTSRCSPSCSSEHRWSDPDVLCISPWWHFVVPACWCLAGFKHSQSLGMPLMAILPRCKDQHVLLCPWLMQRSTWCSLMSPNTMLGMGCGSPKEILDAT